MTSETPRVLLSGRPGCGKTTVIRRTVDRIGTERCVGFYTEEVRKGDRRIGFDIVTLGGERAPLARAGEPGPRVGRYGVDVTGFESVGVRALETGLDTSALLVVDEIGKMELLSDRFVELLGQVFQPGGPQPVLGTVSLGQHPVARDLRNHPEVRVLEVTREVRDGLPARLADLYRPWIEGMERRERGAGGIRTHE